MAYLRRGSLVAFDHPTVVSAILWGQYRRLCHAALFEIAPGANVRQLACVYGDLNPWLVGCLGPAGRLQVVDAAPIQIANLGAKLGRKPGVTPRVGDGAQPGPAADDAILCFFLLHELPDAKKRQVVDAALDRLTPGGRTVFADYARPARWHPLKPGIALVFRLLEPLAARMWRGPVQSLSSSPNRVRWRERRAFWRASPDRPGHAPELTAGMQETDHTICNRARRAASTTVALRAYR